MSVTRCWPWHNHGLGGRGTTAEHHSIASIARWFIVIVSAQEGQGCSQGNVTFRAFSLELAAAMKLNLSLDTGILS